jgi:hypothetical protein
MYDAHAKGTPTMQIRPLIWARDGWPVVGELVNASTFEHRQLKSHELLGTWRQSVEFGADAYHEFLLNGRMTSAVDRATWSFDNHTLQLHWPDPNAPGGAWIDMCYAAPDGKF